MPTEEKDDMTLLAEANERLSAAYLRLLKHCKELSESNASYVEQLQKYIAPLRGIDAPYRNGKGSGPKRHQSAVATTSELEAPQNPIG